LIERGEIAAHGAYFGVAKGELSVRHEASGSFVSMAADESARPSAPVK
jgi:hypothetical protein